MNLAKNLKDHRSALQYVLARLYSELSGARFHDAPWLNHSADERGELPDISSEHLAHEAADEVLVMLHYLAVVLPKTRASMPASILHIQLASVIDAEAPIRDAVATLLAKHEAAIVSEWSERCQQMYAHCHAKGDLSGVRLFNSILRPMMVVK